MSTLRSAKGLVAFVTGSASGLGKGVVQHLVRQGAKVIIADLPSSKGAQLASELKEENALFTPVDVTKSDDITNAFKAAEQRFHRIDALVNCAGIGIAKQIYNASKKLPHPLDEFEKVMRVNVTGTLNVMRLGAQILHKNEPDADGQRGVIVNTASVAAFDGQQGQIAYSASKGAIVAMTLPAARDLCRIGVRVVTIAPGLFDTPLLASLPEKVRTYLAQQIPFPSRLGKPEEFGHLVQFVLENPYINGEVIRLDGALRMPP